MILLLHLSDIHIKSPADPILSKAKEVSASTFSYLATANSVVIIVSGDVVFSGQHSEYALAEQFLRELRELIQNELSVPVRFVIAAGNHDCDFGLNTGTRKLLLKQIAESDLSDIDDSVIETCTAVQSEFFKFRNSLEEPADVVEDDKLWRTHSFKAGNKNIVVDCLNIAWCSQLHEEPGKVYFPLDHYSAKQENVSGDVRILIMHHPLNWFGQSVYRPFRSFVRQVADILVTGHEHQGNVGINDDAESDKSAYIEGCVLQPENKTLKNSSFNIISIDPELSQFASIKFKWNGKRYDPSKEGSWLDYRQLPIKSRNGFSIEQQFGETLDDPGAFLVRSGQNISLSDVFVYPDLKRLDVGDRRSILSASSLLRPEFIANGCLISGEEKSGRTSLLYDLYREYHDRGIVPILREGKQIKSGAERDIESLIRTAVREQYGSNRLTEFEQLSRNKKLLLIDNFDDAPVKDSAIRTKVIQSLQKRFGYFVGTVSDMFEMHELVEVSEPSQPLPLDVYSLQDFNHSRRSELITKWFSSGSEGTVDKAKLLEKRDRAERLINAVMNRRFIPSLPLYLLALLQSIDADRSGKFKESALGYYYQYLLTEAFQREGVKSDKLTEVFQYCVHLAWYFHQKGSDELSEVDIQEFNAQYSKTWHTVDFALRLELLLSGRLGRC